jgi:hypothetical protein
MAVHEEPFQDFFSIGDAQPSGGGSGSQVHAVGGQRLLEGGPMAGRSYDQGCPTRLETSGHIGADPSQQFLIVPIELDDVVAGTRLD